MDNVADLADGVEDTLERLRRVDEGVLEGLPQTYAYYGYPANAANTVREPATNEAMRAFFREAALAANISGDQLDNLVDEIVTQTELEKLTGIKLSRGDVEAVFAVVDDTRYLSINDVAWKNLSDLELTAIGMHEIVHSIDFDSISQRMFDGDIATAYSRYWFPTNVSKDAMDLFYTQRELDTWLRVSEIAEQFYRSRGLSMPDELARLIRRFVESEQFKRSIDLEHLGMSIEDLDNWLLNWP